MSTAQTEPITHIDQHPTTAPLVARLRAIEVEIAGERAALEGLATRLAARTAETLTDRAEQYLRGNDPVSVEITRQSGEIRDRLAVLQEARRLVRDELDATRRVVVADLLAAHRDDYTATVAAVVHAVGELQQALQAEADFAAKLRRAGVASSAWCAPTAGLRQFAGEHRQSAASLFLRETERRGFIK